MARTPSIMPVQATTSPELVLTRSGSDFEGDSRSFIKITN